MLLFLTSNKAFPEVKVDLKLIFLISNFVPIKEVHCKKFKIRTESEKSPQTKHNVYEIKKF